MMTNTPGFHGLFIGVDDYEDAAITGLRFATRDARALHALFTDTFGGNAPLLLNSAATSDSISKELFGLASVSTDSDIVVITFSGHGTRGGQLTTWDTSTDRLTETAISFHELADQIECIPAKVLIVVLDCCFSGGALGASPRRTDIAQRAKVLRQRGDEYACRSTDTEIHELLKRVCGSGQIWLAAAAPDENAYEKAEFGHGVLTYHFLEGLLGHGAARDGDEISLLRLVEQVMTKVGWHRAGLTRAQQNAVLGGMLSNVRIPVLRPGPLYAAIGGALPRPATCALTSLHAHGIPPLFTEVWQRSINRLNEVQVAAVNGAGVLRGQPVLVSAPTASGKTLVGEMAAVKGKQHGKRTAFLLPSRALVNEQYTRFHTLYAPLGVKTVRVTGELRDHLADFLRGNYDFAVLTYEKFTSLLAGQPDLLGHFGVLVVDEIHYLFDPNRGPGLEILLSRLRWARTRGTTPQLIGLSAVLGEPEEVADWLSMELVRSDTRAVPLTEGVIGPDGQCRMRSDQSEFTETRFVRPVHNGDRMSLLIQVVTELVARDRQVIVFRGTREKARRTADALAAALNLMPATKTINALKKGDAGSVQKRLRGCLAGGVAFHVADLADDDRQLVETSFRRTDSEIRVLVATTTLAQGVNLPADAVVISELKHPNDVDYAVSEYKNIAGRAGRRSGSEGQALILTDGGIDADDKWNRYVTAEPDASRSAPSQVRSDLGRLLLRIQSAVAADDGSCRDEDLCDFLNHTLAAHLARFKGHETPFAPDRVRRALEDLVHHELIVRTEDGLAPTRLGRIVVRHGLGTRSVRRIAQVLADIGPDELTDRNLVCIAQIVDELHDARFVRMTADPRGTLDQLLAWLREPGVSDDRGAPVRPKWARESERCERAPSHRHLEVDQWPNAGGDRA